MFLSPLLLASHSVGANEASTQIRACSTFSDSFDGRALDRRKWDVFRDRPRVANGRLVLVGAEVQSRCTFSRGVLRGVVASSVWRSHSTFTDSSFGFEIWTGTGGTCHYGVVFEGGGHLGILRSVPDASGRCAGDPARQVYPPVSNWDVLRGAGNVSLSFTLRLGGGRATLQVRDGSGTVGRASYAGDAIPDVRMRLRLNTFSAGRRERYAVDGVRVSRR